MALVTLVVASMRGVPAGLRFLQHWWLLRSSRIVCNALYCTLLYFTAWYSSVLCCSQVPTVTTEPRVKFLRSSGFPKIGGYCAAAVPAGSGGPASGSYQGVVAVDTLLPDGHGQALTQEEVRSNGHLLDSGFHLLYHSSCQTVC